MQVHCGFRINKRLHLNTIPVIYAPLFRLIKNSRIYASSAHCRYCFQRFFFCFRSFIVAISCLSEQRPKKTVSCYGGYGNHTGRNYWKLRLVLLQDFGLKQYNVKISLIHTAQSETRTLDDLNASDRIFNGRTGVDVSIIIFYVNLDRNVDLQQCQGEWLICLETY